MEATTDWPICNAFAPRVTRPRPCASGGGGCESLHPEPGAPSGGAHFYDSKMEKGLNVARPRTPTKILDARGAFKRHPERKRDGEPVVKDPLGSPPDRLTELERQAWREVAMYAPPGVLTSADRIHVEELSILLAESWVSRADMQTSTRALLNKMLGQLGMNPSDRSKISIEKPKDANPFAAFD